MKFPSEEELYLIRLLHISLISPLKFLYTTFPTTYLVLHAPIILSPLKRKRLLIYINTFHVYVAIKEAKIYKHDFLENY